MATTIYPTAANAAHVVGYVFVNQYYNVLHQSPSVVHRFYTDVSQLTRAEAGPNGVIDTVVTQNEIHKKIMSLDYGDYRAEIKSVDSQESFAGGVLVMVTGSLSNKANEKRDFVQIFFLAPQEKGYFVLNDIFRYLDEEKNSVRPMYITPNGVQETAIPPYANSVPNPLGMQQEAPPMSNGPQEFSADTILPSESVHESSFVEESEFRDNEAPVSEDDGLADEVYDLTEEPHDPEVEEELPVEEVVHSQVPAPTEDSVSLDDSVASQYAQGELPKKSYASILRVAKDSAVLQYQSPQATQPVIPKVATTNADRPPVPSVSASPSPPSNNLTPPAPPASILTAEEENNNPVENGGDGKWIYIKNLPLNTTASQLEEEFKKFGPTKPGGITVKKQQTICYAFIEFEDLSSAQAALEASPVQIGDRQAHVEERRSTGVKAFRGRMPFNKERSFRNDSGRGRGYFSGRGRGYGSERDREAPKGYSQDRGDRDNSTRGYGQDRDRDAVRGRGSGRGNYGGASSNHANHSNPSANGNDDGYRRYDSANGNPSRPRRGSGNQMFRNASVPRNTAVTAS